MIFNNPNIYNIFTDASIIKTIYGETIGCAGAVGVPSLNSENTIVSTQILRNSTNNNSEITAILLGIHMALNVPKNYKINLFSDSKICVYGLREWIFNWANNRLPDGTMVSSSGTPVANQNIFLDIINLIIVNKLPINIYHQKGHVTNTEDSLSNATKVFFESNGILLDKNDVINISDMNNYIDNYTRAKLNTYMDNKNNVGKNVLPSTLNHTKAIERIVTDNMFEIYQSLVDNYRL